MYVVLCYVITHKDFISKLCIQSRRMYLTWLYFVLNIEHNNLLTYYNKSISWFSFLERRHSLPWVSARLSLQKIFESVQSSTGSQCEKLSLPDDASEYVPGSDSGKDSNYSLSYYYFVLTLEPLGGWIHPNPL